MRERAVEKNAAADSQLYVTRALEAVDADRPELVHRHVQAGLAARPDEATELRLRIIDTGWTLEDQGPEQAREALAVLAAQVTAYPDMVELCRAQVAFTHLRGGELVTAAQVLAEVDDAILAPRERIRILLNRGTLASHLRAGEGEEDLRSALSVASSQGWDLSAFRALHNLGWSAFLRGDLPAALRLMHDADALDVEVDRTVARLDLARVQLEAGLIREARDVLAVAAEGAVSAGQQHSSGEIDLELARTHMLLADPLAAVEACRRARTTFEALGAGGWATRARLREIIAAGFDDWERTGTDPASLLQELATLGGAARDEGDVGAWIAGTLARARLHLAQDEITEAEAALESLGTAATDQAAYLTTRLSVLDLRARLALARGRRPRAVRTLNRAADELAEARNRPASLDLRTAVGAHARSLADLDLQLAADTGRPWSLLGAAERWRPSGDELPSVLPPRDPETAELTRTLRSLREEVRMAPPGADTRPLLSQVRRLEHQVRSLNWSAGQDPHRGSRRTRHDHVPVTQLAQTLAVHGRGLVSYIPVGEELRAVVVAPGAGAVGVRLGEVSTLQELVARVRADITALATAGAPGPLLSAVSDSLNSELAELAGALVTPVLQRLPDDAPLVIAPTSLLGNLPWGMLPGTRGRPLVVARSMTAWCQAQPTTTGDDPPTGAAAASVGAMAGPGLPCAAEEVEALTQIYSGSVRAVTAADSSADALAELLGTRSTVHVAAHGVHDHENPLFSYVRTAEGPAFAHEFLHDRVTARHVVVAACEGGRASFRPGEEPLGFAATLLARGVRTVVAPAFAVPDVDAHTLMIAHHRLLADGVDPVTALAAATEQAPLLAGSFTAFGSG